MVEHGHVRYVGVSNWAAWQIMKALGISERLGLARFQSLQAYYTIAGRDLERELVPMLQSEGLGLMVWSPLAGGFLSGKYGRDQAGEAGSRRTAFDFPPLDKERAYDAIDVMREIAGARGVSVAQIALAWLLHQPAVTSVIIGAEKPEQLADNIGATRVALDAGELPGSTRSASCRPSTRAGCSRARARSGASRSPKRAVRRVGLKRRNGRKHLNTAAAAARSKVVAEERKVCVVTGSSSGIGAATVKLYAKQGWNVVVNYSREAAPAEAVASECRELGADVLVARADIAADADCRRLAGLVEARFGRADVLVNNAGTTKFVAAKDLDGLDADDFQRIYAVNVIGAFQMVRAFAPLLGRQPGAAIVNVSSIASLMGTGSSLAYMASKGALNALTIGLARSLGPAIRVNAIAPGWSRRRGCRTASAPNATPRRCRATAPARRSTP
jgi:NAD(P)-dependent dehydrogenase (short-subunit alcohol dehydrogenase family)